MNVDFLSLLGSYCFPIVACCVMAWYTKYCNDKNREEIDKINVQHKNEMQEVTTALNNNTLAIEKLCILIGEKND